MPPLARHRLWARAPFVTLVYVAVSLATTWPLVTVMTRQIAGDTGDPLFICWILLWTSGQVLQALHGDWSALFRYWNGNIFYPAPLTLTYSEHFAPQMLQALPIFAATDNIILCYNALLLATIVLSGLGMYLLVRELTGEPMAAFLAGLAFACRRIDQLPTCKFCRASGCRSRDGFRRFFVAGRGRWSAGHACSRKVFQALLFVLLHAVCGRVLPPRDGGPRPVLNVRSWRMLFVVGGSGLLVVCVFMWPMNRCDDWAMSASERPIRSSCTPLTHTPSRRPRRTRDYGDRGFGRCRVPRARAFRD